jgi:hypothetical protein
MPTYTVFVDDNFHYMDQIERYKHGDFNTCEAAIAACKRIVDEFLLSSLESPRTHDELLTLYTIFGEDPFIQSPDPNCRFSARDYASQRCKDLTQTNS